MKTYFNHLTHTYDTPDGTKVAAEICESDNLSDAFRAAAIREQQRKKIIETALGIKE